MDRNLGSFFIINFTVILLDSKRCYLMWKKLSLKANDHAAEF